jgi:small-conductance mechanosensitive channel
MAEFFNYPLVYLTSTVAISLLNIVIWVFLYIIARIAKRALKKYVRKQNIHNQQITLAGKEITFISLGRQLLNILLVVAALQSLSITNNGAGLKELLDIKLLSYGKLNISVFNVSLFIILLVSAKLLTTLMRLFVQRTVTDKKWIDKGKEYTIVTLAKYFIYTVCIVIGLRSFGFDLTFIVASSAALLVGIGLGVQKIFADIISGFIILFEGNF